jgi:Rieske Fe-S protein
MDDSEQSPTDQASRQATGVTGLGRRRVLVSGVGVAAAGLLAACGDDGTSGGGGSGGAEPTSGGAGSGGGSEGGDEGGDGGGGGAAVGAVADVAVGGGLIVADQQLVVTQPSEGEFRGFDSTCTHLSCQVSGISDTIDCSCHGSRFSLEDGSVVSGPATEPLAEKAITVEGGTIRLA